MIRKDGVFLVCAQGPIKQNLDTFAGNQLHFVLFMLPMGLIPLLPVFPVRCPRSRGLSIVWTRHFHYLRPRVLRLSGMRLLDKMKVRPLTSTRKQPVRRSTSNATSEGDWISASAFCTETLIMPFLFVRVRSCSTTPSVMPFFPIWAWIGP